MEIIVKQYNHINKAFSNWDTPQGKLIKSKQHYDYLMKEGGYITYEESLDRQNNKKMKEYVPSEKAKAILAAACAHKDKKGRIRLSGRTIEAMKSIGAYKEIPNYMKLPQHYQPKGGFNT